MIYIIIPYRDREKQLIKYLTHTIPLVKECLDDFRIIVIEQCNTKPFNRGLLINVAVNHLKIQPDDEIIFQDVNVLPQRSVIFECYKDKVDNATVLGIYSHAESLGGVIKMRKSTFESINGFPTNYWGWGFESNTLRERLNIAGIKVKVKYSPNTSLGNKNFLILDDVVSISREKRIEGERNETLHKFFCQNNREKKIYTMERSGLSTTHFKVLRHMCMNKESFLEFITVDI